MEWDAFVTAPAEKVYLHGLAAQHASRLGRHTSALGMMREAERPLERIGTRDDHITHAAIKGSLLINAGRPGEALAALPQPAHAHFYMRIGINLAWAQALWDTGEKGAAARHLTQAYADMETYACWSFKAKADAMAQRL